MSENKNSTAAIIEGDSAVQDVNAPSGATMLAATQDNTGAPTEEVFTHTTQVNALDPNVYMQMPVILKTSVTTSDLPGKTVAMFSVHPKVFSPFTAWLTDMYYTWGGPMELGMRIAATMMNGGALIVAKVPPGINAEALSMEQLTGFPYEIVDFKTQGLVTFPCSDQRNVMYHYIWDEEIDLSGTIRVLTRNSTGGTIVVKIYQSPTTSSTGPTTIDVTFSGRPLPEFCFSQLKIPSIRGPNAASLLPPLPFKYTCPFVAGVEFDELRVQTTSLSAWSGVDALVRFDRRSLTSKSIPTGILKPSLTTATVAQTISKVEIDHDYETTYRYSLGIKYTDQPSKGAIQIIIAAQRSHFQDENYTGRTASFLDFSQLSTGAQTNELGGDWPHPSGTSGNLTCRIFAAFRTGTPDVFQHREPNSTTGLAVTTSFNESLITFNFISDGNEMGSLNTLEYINYILTNDMPKDQDIMYRLVDTMTGLPLRYVRWSRKGYFSTAQSSTLQKYNLTRVKLEFDSFISPNSRLPQMLPGELANAELLRRADELSSLVNRLSVSNV